MKNKKIIFLISLFLVGLLFALFFVGEFDRGFLGNSDVAQWSYQGYYLSKNLTFRPWPSLELVNNQGLYPYGISNVFSPWFFELNYFFAAAGKLFGEGPWGQIYFCLSILATALGVFFIMNRELSAPRAFGMALAASFLNYYAIAKYPHQMSYCCAHWLFMAIGLNYVAYRRFINRRPLTARLCLSIVAVHLLCFGLSLGYVTGFALTSLAVFAACFLAVGLTRAEFRLPENIGGFKVGAKTFWAGLNRLGKDKIILGLVIGAAAFFYLPLASQVYAEAKNFGLSGLEMKFYPTALRRFFLPFGPGFGPAEHIRFLWGDLVEAHFTLSPGLSFVLVGFVGLVASICRKGKRVLVFPPVILLALFLVSQQKGSFFLGVFPWHALVRVPARVTIMFPFLLAILAAEIPTAVIRKSLGRLAAAVIFGFFLVEVGTAYCFLVKAKESLYKPGPDFYQLMGKVRETQGEALFEWPFCVADGTDVATSHLCPYYGKLVGVFSLQQFHDKKTISRYFGRLQREQVEILLRTGWQLLFSPDTRDLFCASRQTRDFSLQEWDFLEWFIASNDFAGIMLYTDLLPDETVEGFYRRFGEPAAEASVFEIRTQFIPKPDRLRFSSPPERKEFRLASLIAPPVDLETPIPANETAGNSYFSFGWEPMKRAGRWTVGKEAELIIPFSAKPGKALSLVLKGHAFEKQTARVFLNDSLVGILNMDQPNIRDYVITLPPEAVAKTNFIRLELPDAHSPLSSGVSQDPRQLGVFLVQFSVSEEIPGF